MMKAGDAAKTRTRNLASITPPKLWYFTDPMCSWCWGFTPAIESIREEYGARLQTELVVGGLHPSETSPLTDVAREDIYHDWRQVHERSGQPFDFDRAIPAAGFVCNSEPPSRAVVSAASLDEELTLPMMRAIQSAFFADGRDVTKTETLADLAAELGFDRGAFLELFETRSMRDKTHAQFVKTRQMGVRGLPALILQQGDELHHICNSWQPLAKIHAALDARLDESS